MIARDHAGYGNRAVPLQKGGSAAGEGGASAEMMGDAIGRGTSGVGPEHYISIGARRGQLKRPREHRGEGQVQAVLPGEFEASGFEGALAAIMVAVRGAVAVMMLGLATSGQQAGAAPQTMRGGRQPSCQHHQRRHVPESFHCLSNNTFGRAAQGFSGFACLSGRRAGG